MTQRSPASPEGSCASQIRICPLKHYRFQPEFLNLTTIGGAAWREVFGHGAELTNGVVLS